MDQARQGAGRPRAKGDDDSGDVAHGNGPLLLTLSGHFRVFSRMTAWRTERAYAFMHLHL